MFLARTPLRHRCASVRSTNQTLRHPAGPLEHFAREEHTGSHALCGIPTHFLADLWRALRSRVGCIGRFFEKVEGLLGQTPFAAHGIGANQGMGLGAAGHVATTLHIALPRENPDVAHEKGRDFRMLLADVQPQAIRTSHRNSGELHLEPPPNHLADVLPCPTSHGGTPLAQRDRDASFAGTFALDDGGGPPGAETLEDLAVFQAGENFDWEILHKVIVSKSGEDASKWAG